MGAPFGRKPRRRDDPKPGGAFGGSPQVPDPDLPLLSRERADRFRALVADVMGRMRQRVAVNGDTAERADGYSFGLSNLSAVIARLDERDWPPVVERHLTTVVGASQRPAPGPAALDEHLLARLVDVGGLGANPHAAFSYGSEFAPGVLRLLCVDEPETVRLLGDTAVSHLSPLGPALDLGLRNLQRMIATDEESTCETVEQSDGPAPAPFHLLSGESVYVASYALCLPQVLEKWAPELDVSRGVMFAIPWRNVLAFAPVGDAAEIIATMQALAPVAIAGYHHNAGSVSPNVLLREPSGVITQLSSFDGERILMTPGPLEKYLVDVEGTG